MTDKKTIEQHAEEYQNSGCIKSPIIENARTRWAKEDFLAGAAKQKELCDEECKYKKEYLISGYETLMNEASKREELLMDTIIDTLHGLDEILAEVGTSTLTYSICKEMRKSIELKLKDLK